jgi:RNA polymerase sigma-B factor
LVVRLLPLAHKLARRYSHTSVPYEDLVQVASLALVKAIDRFDPSLGTSFEAFAIPTILGELKRYFRDSAWSVHVSRAAQERALLIDRATEKLINRFGRSPTVHEIAGYLELDQEQVLEGLRAARAYTTVSLDAPPPSGGEGDDPSLEDALGVEDQGYELVDTGLAIGGAVRKLGRSERRILEMRFGEEMTQSEIGARLGVSQMQVSRLLRRSLSRLRALAGGER